MCADEKGGVAVKLQAVQRGRQERKQRVKEGEAALGIQAMIRGKQARAEVDTLKNRMVLAEFEPTRPLDVLSIDLLNAAGEAAAAAGTKPPTFERLAMKFPTIAEALTQVRRASPFTTVPVHSCADAQPLASQVKMMFDLEAVATPSLNLEPGITLMQIGGVLTKIGVELGEDAIASIFEVPGMENIFTAAGASEEALSFSVRMQAANCCAPGAFVLTPSVLALTLSVLVWSQDFLGFLYVGRSSGKLPPVESCDLDGAFEIAVQAFQLFDTSGDGAIVLKEMSKAIKADIETLQERMSEADTDGNGYITFPEFCALPARCIPRAPLLPCLVGCSLRGPNRTLTASLSPCVHSGRGVRMGG